MSVYVTMKRQRGQLSALGAACCKGAPVPAVQVSGGLCVTPPTVWQCSGSSSSFNMESCSAYKAGRRKGNVWSDGFLTSQVTVRHDTALLSWKQLNTCLLMGSWKWIPCLDLLVCMAFTFLIKLSLSQPSSFLTFTLTILSPPSHCGGSEQVSGCVAGFKPQQLIYLNQEMLWFSNRERKRNKGEGEQIYL